MNLKRILNHDENDCAEDSFPVNHGHTRRRLDNPQSGADHPGSYLSEDVLWNESLPNSYLNLPSLDFETSDLVSSGVETPNDHSFLNNFNDEDFDFLTDAYDDLFTAYHGPEPTNQIVISDEHLNTRGACETSIHDGVAHKDVICYGMAYRARIQVVGEPEKLRRALNSDTVTIIGAYLVFDAVFKREQLMLLTQNGEDVATLNQNTSNAMKRFSSDPTITLQALVHLKAFHQILTMSSTSKTEHGTVNLNIYGPRTLAIAVGDVLSAHKIYLQRPDWFNPTTIYENPHVLELPRRENGPQAFHAMLVQGANENIVESTLADVYSSLTRGNELKRVRGDSRLSTDLLPHQQQALDFMAQREHGPVPEPYRLWQQIESDDQITYRHIITGANSPTLPSEVGGGILADEMGMGKTYSILARMVQTLEDAQKWSQDPDVYMSTDIPSHKRLYKATLVVVPTPLLLTAWKKEITKRLKVELTVCTHHGPSRINQLEKLAEADIVLTTYHTLVADYVNQKAPLEQIAWYRIVLDEAHFIRRTSTLLHKRVSELDGMHRWCLTGTPIQNHLDDIGALLVFIRAEPFDRMGMFRRHISAPFYDNTDRSTSRQNLTKLIDSLCVRRTKELLHLSNHHDVVRTVTFSPAEDKQYRRTIEDMREAMQDLEGKHDGEHRFGMFQANLQLRLLCNHGTFQKQEHWANTGLWRGRKKPQQTGPDSIRPPVPTIIERCGVCQQAIGSVRDIGAGSFIESCEHIICEGCLGSMDDPCPICESSNFIQPKYLGVLPLQDLVKDDYFCAEGVSSKMNLLMTDVCQNAAGDKSIIFSCWTTTLDLVAKYLRSRSIRFERIDGRTSFRNRQRILDQFEDNPLLPVLIMTTGVGALGLNLIAANRIFLIEPQWNPSVENQAIGRALRIGQAREVTVTRYIVDKTIEQDMQGAQYRKLAIARMATKKP